MLISIQKLFFGDDDAIYDVINEEQVWKWRHNYRHEFSRDPFAELSIFYTYSTIFIFRQIDTSNIAVRGPTSLLYELSLSLWFFFNTWDIPCSGTTFYFLSAILTRTITCITLHTFLLKTYEKWLNKIITWNLDFAIQLYMFVCVFACVRVLLGISIEMFLLTDYATLSIVWSSTQRSAIISSTRFTGPLTSAIVFIPTRGVVS